MSGLLQLRKQLALEAERQVEVDQAAADSEAALTVPHWCITEEPLHLISILKAYSDLGFHPSHALLAAAEPFLSSVLNPIPLQQTLDLITLFRLFAWQPGQSCALALSVRFNTIVVGQKVVKSVEARSATEC